MARTPDTHPGRGFQVSRRTAILGSILAPSAVLAACAEKAPDNSAVIADLKSKLEVTSATTRQSFAQRSAEIAIANPTWQANSKIEFTSDLGNKVSIRIDQKGQPFADVSSKDAVVVEYIDPRSAGVGYSLETVSGENDRHFVVYGTANTVGLFRNKKDEIHKFLQEYFGDSKVLSTIHFIFLPHPPPIDLIDVGKRGRKLQSTPTQARIITDGKGNNIEAFEVIINIPFLHRTAAQLRISLEAELRKSLTNEMVNLLIDQTVPVETLKTRPTPEGISTYAGYLAQLDKDFAKMILGGTAYEPFVKLVADEMRRIGKVKKAT